MHRIVRLSVLDRLRKLCQEKKRESSKPYQTEKSWAQLVVKKKPDQVFSSSLRSGLEESESYVNAHPENADGKELSKAIHGGEQVHKRLEAMAVGAEVAEVKPKLGRKATKKLKKMERERTKGDAWFGMGAPEITEDTRRDLEVLQMRNSLDPKRFYKKNDHEALPKYFQIGHVVESAADFYSDRVPNKKRKKTLVEELMADAEFQKYNKRKYAEIIQKKEKSTYSKKRKFEGLKKSKKKQKQSAE